MREICYSQSTFSIYLGLLTFLTVTIIPKQQSISKRHKPTMIAIARNQGNDSPKKVKSISTSTRGSGSVGATSDYSGFDFTEPENGTKPMRRFPWSWMLYHPLMKASPRIQRSRPSKAVRHRAQVDEVTSIVQSSAVTVNQYPPQRRSNDGKLDLELQSKR